MGNKITSCSLFLFPFWLQVLLAVGSLGAAHEEAHLRSPRKGQQEWKRGEVDGGEVDKGDGTSI